MPSKKEEMFGDPTVPASRTTEATLSLFLFGEQVQGRFPLPAQGQVVVGRGEGVEISIDDPSVSRRHAVLHVGETLRIEDVGSSNGTRVRDETLRPNWPVEIAAGEPFEIGTTMAVVQRPAGFGARPRRLATHSYFEIRLEEECERALRTGSLLAVLRLRGPGREPELRERLSAALRPGDLLASYGPADYDILLPDTAPDTAQTFTETLRESLEDLGVELTTGLACFGRDGRTAESLIARAGDQVLGAAPPGRGVIVRDEVMRRLYALAERVADSVMSVLILGETGVGKEVLAETIHDRSARRGQPLMRLNCAALSETLLESELFGHERGAFTGATQAKPGLLEAAHGGTVFLDEVGELPLQIQVKLLRVIEDRTVLRVGSVKPRAIDVRFVAATNANLEEAILDKRFRQDLYYRLNGISLVIPPLRERPAEVEALARQFVSEAAQRAGLSHQPPLTPEAAEQLRAYEWPGNIRELRNVIERAVLLSGGEPITLVHLPIDKMRSTLLRTRARPETTPPARHLSASEVTQPVAAGVGPDLRSAVEEVERQRIIDALDACGGNQTRAARMLGISRTTLSARLDAYQIKRPRKRG